MQSEQQSEQQNDSGENSGQNSGENNDEQNNNNNNNTNTINEHNLPLANPINPLAIHQSPVDQLVNAFNFKKGSKSPTERFHVRDQHSPVYGFLYFATPDGKRRALKQALQVFGLSTASGYAITTQDASTKNQLVIAGLHRSMSSSDVAHFIKETLGNKMSLNKSISTINAVSTNASDQAHISQQYNSNVENHGDIKTSVIDRIYVPRSFARSFGGSDYFNNNRGYAIVTFDGHDTAFEAFSHLQNATIDLINPANKDQNGTKSVDKVERIDELLIKLVMMLIIIIIIIIIIRREAQQHRVWLVFIGEKKRLRNLNTNIQSLVTFQLLRDQNNISSIRLVNNLKMLYHSLLHKIVGFLPRKLLGP
jgi:hypothetical protein